jgi:arylsulfatase
MRYRRTFLISILVLGMVSMQSCADRGALQPDKVAAANEQLPNILLVMVDDMGWTDIGPFGSEIETTNIDALAERGVLFSDFHVSVSCSPTRSMLMSGTDNHLAGLGNMGEMLAPEQRGKPGYEGYLNDRVVSLAEILRDGGYHTYMAGKWHLGHSPGQYPADRGFEQSFSMLLGGASYWSDMFGMLAVHEEVAEYVLNDEQLESLPADFYATRNFTDFVIDSIRSDRGDGKPFFAYLAFTSPHDPLHVPEPWASQYRGAYDDGYEALKARRTARAIELGLVPNGASVPERHPMLPAWDSLSEDDKALGSRGMEVYAGMVTNMDYHFGRVVNFLKDIGEYDNTIILFLSDNGPNPWSSEDYPGNAGSEWFAQFDNDIDNIGHPMSHYAYGMGWGSASAGPLDLFKMTVGQGGIRSPLIIAGPGVEGGRKVDAFSYVTDVMPTLLDVAAIEAPKEFNGNKVEPILGRSLAPVLSGQTDRVYGPDDFVSGEMQNGKWTRQGDFKAVSVSAPYGSGEWKLFNIADDPGETRDLSADEPATLARLQAAWDHYAEDVGVILTGQ